MARTTTLTGRFRFTTTTQKWWWCDDMFTIHGMQRGEVVPTRDVVLAHAVPGDRERVADALDSSAESTEARSCEYVLRDLQGAERTVLMTLAHDDARPDGPAVTGFLVDRTAVVAAAISQRVTAQLTTALESHAVIDQAKGVLMLTYGVDSDAAFELLRASSQERNVRLRTLAERVVEAAQHGTDPEVRERLDLLVARALADANLPTAATDHAPLRLASDNRAGAVILRVGGRLDLLTKEDADAAITRTLRDAKHQGRMLLDVRDVRPLGPVLSEVLCTAMRRAAAQGITLTIVGGHACNDLTFPALPAGLHSKSDSWS